MAPPLILREEQERYPLGLHLDILEDPSGKLTIDDVYSPAYESRFFPSQVEVPNFGLTTNVYWLRLSLDNRTYGIREWLLEDAYVNAQYVDLYIPRGAGKGFDVKQTGFLRSNTTRDVMYPHTVFKLDLAPQSQQTYYLRFQSQASMTLPLTLWTADSFFNKSQLELLVNWLFLGGLLALLLYHLFLLVTLREASYLFFVFLLGSLCLFFSNYGGYLGTYIFPQLYKINFSFLLFFAMMLASLILFSDAFLEIRKRHPKLHWFNLGLAGCWGVFALLTPWIGYHTLARLMALWALFSLAATFWVGIMSWREGFLPARFFMVAWLGLITIIFVLLLVRLSIVRSTFITENIYQPGMLLMTVAWSIALADRINLFKGETENAVFKLQRSERRLSQILDGVPLGIAVYGKDQRPEYANKRAVEIMSNPEQGIQAGVQVRRSLSQAIDYFSLRIFGTKLPYPVEKIPIYSALQGQPASVDDLEADLGNRQVPLEMWASPVTDLDGNVESAVVAFQNITQRKQTEAELIEYRKHLELMVENRTRELNAANEELRMHLEWLDAMNLVNQTVASTNDFSQMYEKIVEIARQIFRALDAYIVELDAGGKQLKILAHSCSKGDCSSLIGSLTTLPNGIPSGKDKDSGEPAFITRDQIGVFDNPFGEHIRNSALQTMIIIPLRVREQMLGFLGLEMLEAVNNISREENHILQILSTDVAQIIQNAHLLEQSRLLIAVDERNRLARDLHDSVAQAFFGIRLYANAIQMAQQKNKLDDLLNHIKEMNKLAQQGQADMRLLIFQLRPPLLDAGGLPGALQNRLNAVESRAGFKVEFEANELINLTPEQELELYQMAQEILNNIIKHAQADTVKVRITDEGGYFRMMIADNGVGFNIETAEQSGGQGLRNLRERAKKIGATCTITSAPDQGTKILVEMGH